MSARSAVLAVILLAVGGCAKPAVETRVLVFAATSLTASFERLAQDFERSHPGTKLELHFAGSPQLGAQLRNGAEADVFASADLANMQQVVDGKQTASAPSTFAHNRMAIVVGKGNPKRIGALADLARNVRVLLCGPVVPAGHYARQALAKAGVAVASLSDEPNVGAVVTKVKLGEVDAGIVYVTDAAVAAADVDSVAIPAEHNVVAAYPIAVLSVGRNQGTGAAFVAHVLSAEGQRVLRSFGFQAP